MSVLETISLLTTRVVAGSQEDSTSGLLDADNVRGSWSTENAILANDKLLDTVRCANLCDQLGDLGVVVASVTTDDKE